MTVDGKNKFLKKIMFTTEEGNVIVCYILNVICSGNARKYSEEILRRLTFVYFEKVAEFSIPSSFTE